MDTRPTTDTDVMLNNKRCIAASPAKRSEASNDTVGLTSPGMSEFAVGTQRANENGKRVTSGKTPLRDRDERRRNCVLS